MPWQKIYDFRDADRSWRYVKINQYQQCDGFPAAWDIEDIKDQDLEVQMDEYGYADTTWARMARECWEYQHEDKLIAECHNGIWRTPTGLRPPIIDDHSALKKIKAAIEKINELDLWDEPMYHEIEQYIEEIEAALKEALGE